MRIATAFRKATNVRASLPAPGTAAYDSIYFNDPLFVTEKTLLSIPAAKGAIQFKGTTIGKLPLHAYENGERLAEQPEFLTQPDPRQPRQTTISQMVYSILMHGNAYALVDGWEVDHEGRLYPTVMAVLHPNQVGYDAQTDEFRIQGQPVTARLMHVPGPLTLPGSRLGLGVLDLANRTIDHAVRLEEYRRRFYADNAMPLAVYKWNEEVSDEELQALKRKIMTEQVGRREPLVLPPTIDFTPVMNATEKPTHGEDARQLAQDVVNFVGLPGYFIGAPGDSMTYKNLEQDGLNLVKFYLPELDLLEAVFTSMLPSGQEAKFNLDAVLEADTLGRYRAHAIAIQNGFLTRDEARELENRPPLTPEQLKELVALSPLIPAESLSDRPNDPEPVSEA